MAEYKEMCYQMYREIEKAYIEFNRGNDANMAYILDHALRYYGEEIFKAGGEYPARYHIISPPPSGVYVLKDGKVIRVDK